MKKIGLIGGIGPESSVEYYRLIIKNYQAALGTKDYPEFLIYSINMTEMLEYVYHEQFEKLADFLARKIRILENAGAEYGAILSNTPHIVFNSLVHHIKIPLISIVEETCRTLSESKVKKAGLFGTKMTMTGEFYEKAAAKHGIEIVIPSPQDMEYINSKYFSELVFNKIVPETKKQLIEIAHKMKLRDLIEGLVLGGTELPLILGQSDFPDIRIFDSTKIHVESIVGKMIE